MSQHPWKTCKNPLCGDPFPNIPGIKYCSGMCEDEHQKMGQKNG